MIIELVLALGLSQSDTTALIQPSADDNRAFAKAETYDNWQSLVKARELANISGFGSIAVENDDGSYTLHYVFRGSTNTIGTQLDRLNDVLGSELELYEPDIVTVGEAPSMIADNEANTLPTLKEGYQINVSSNFEKTPITSESPVSNEPIIAPTLDDGTNNDNIEWEARKDIVSPRATQKEVASPVKNTNQKDAPKIEELPKEIEAADFVRDYEFAIVFGSFKNEANAKKKQLSLEKDGIKSELLGGDEFIRVGIKYNKYPATALKEFQNQDIKCWLLRFD